MGGNERLYKGADPPALALENQGKGALAAGQPAKRGAAFCRAAKSVRQAVSQQTRMGMAGLYAHTV
jgi:hypothetical protein